jgi:hypothetical protein
VSARAVKRARDHHDRLVARGARPRAITRANNVRWHRAQVEEDRLIRERDRDRARRISVQEFVKAVESGAVATLPPNTMVSLVGGQP